MDYEIKLDVLTAFVKHRFYVLEALSPIADQRNECLQHKHADDI